MTILRITYDKKMKIIQVHDHEYNLLMCDISIGRDDDNILAFSLQPSIKLEDFIQEESPDAS